MLETTKKRDSKFCVARNLRLLLLPFRCSPMLFPFSSFCSSVRVDAFFYLSVYLFIKATALLCERSGEKNRCNSCSVPYVSSYHGCYLCFVLDTCNGS
jgi:hypothetical protein